MLSMCYGSDDSLRHCTVSTYCIRYCSCTVDCVISIKKHNVFNGPSPLSTGFHFPRFRPPPESILIPFALGCQSSFHFSLLRWCHSSLDSSSLWIPFFSCFLSPWFRQFVRPTPFLTDSYSLRVCLSLGFNPRRLLSMELHSSIPFGSLFHFASLACSARPWSWQWRVY